VDKYSRLAHLKTIKCANMLKTFKRMSSGSVPMKQIIEIRIKTLIFDVIPLHDSNHDDDDDDRRGPNQVLFANDLIAIGFEREKKNAATMTAIKTITTDPPTDLDFQEELLSLPVTFYKESNGVIMDKMGSLVVYKLPNKSATAADNKLVLGSASLALHTYFNHDNTQDEVPTVHAISLRVERNGKPIGVTLDILVSAKAIDPVHNTGHNKDGDNVSASEHDEVASVHSHSSMGGSPRAAMDGKKGSHGSFRNLLGFGDKSSPKGQSFSASDHVENENGETNTKVPGNVRPSLALQTPASAPAAATGKAGAPSKSAATAEEKPVPSPAKQAATPDAKLGTSPTLPTAPNNKAVAKANVSENGNEHNSYNNVHPNESIVSKPGVKIDKDKQEMMNQILALRTECKDKQAAFGALTNTHKELQSKLASTQVELQQANQQMVIANENIEKLTLELNTAKSELLAVTMMFTPKSKDDEVTASVKQQLEAYSRNKQSKQANGAATVALPQAALELLRDKQVRINQLEQQGNIRAGAGAGGSKSAGANNTSTVAAAAAALAQSTPSNKPRRGSEPGQQPFSSPGSFSWEPDSKHLRCMLCDTSFTFTNRR
jgi:hypothetical protein